MRISSAVATDVGRAREANEDAYLARDPLFVVADGMGGHVAGDIASATAIETIEREWDGSADPDALSVMIKDANRSVYEKAEGDPELHGMGTTCTAILVDSDRAHVAHVGDSRAYLLRDGELTQVTEDHTVVGRMEREGKLTKEEAARHPHRNVITRALGIEIDVDVDTWELELTEGDRLLICSDGLNGMVDDSDIRQILMQEADPNGAVHRLVDEANAAGGEDNITVILLDAVSDDHSVPTAAPPPPAGAELGEPREDTAPVRPNETQIVGTPERPPRRRFRRSIWTLMGLAVVGALLFGAARWTLSNSWYVGLNDDDFVTIYQGIPDEIAGLTLKEQERATNIHVDDLPEFRRNDVRTGIKVDSQDEALETVDNLQREVERSQPSDRKKS
ncbi:MAG: Stp1/IreP family PP2C-type Ser/Thr phosphatase [Actinobacteria bacterium]|nr:Stp1/IreP family PP2C-type Ser/Thr phosphatase [Actinomycetota bacterium]